MRSNNRHSARPGSSIALAVAMLCGTALGTAALETPAFAQKEEKPKYSRAFQKAYEPMVPLANAEAVDEAAIRAAIPAMTQAIETPDDKNAAGGLLLSVGGKIQDSAMQLQGLNLMIESGKNNDRIGQFHYAAYQIHNRDGNIPAAREALIKASETGYSFEGRMSDGTSQTIDAGDLRAMAAETYFEQDQYEAGLDDLLAWLKSREAAGQPIKESWIRRGFATAFNNQLPQQATEFGAFFLQHYPSAKVWADAIAVQNGFFEYDAQEVLDLMRLARRTGVLSPDRLASMDLEPDREEQIRGSLVRFYLDYADAADFRRLPGEVKGVLDEGVANGVLDASDVTVSDWLNGANGRIADDQSELPALERDARSGSELATVTAAADAFLSYGEMAKAEEFYTKALTLPGVDTPRTLTRLGIAQADQGKYAEAIATFGKVEGKREQIARLWSIYAEQKAKQAPSA